jgi:uncharacterized DUF497 family protein
MEFEFDQNKSKFNKEKHGIDFVEAQQMWLNKTVEATIIHKTEPRYIVFGEIDNKNWSAIITYRSENIRLISVRRSRKDEINYYERNK